VHPNFANVDVTANMSDSEGSRGPAQPATASVSTVQPEIYFNNKKYSSWRDARDEYARLSNTGTSKVWIYGVVILKERQCSWLSIDTCFVSFCQVCMFKEWHQVG
jgi:hypothetical protein